MAAVRLRAIHPNPLGLGFRGRRIESQELTLGLGPVVGANAGASGIARFQDSEAVAAVRVGRIGLWPVSLACGIGDRALGPLPRSVKLALASGPISVLELPEGSIRQIQPALAWG